MNRPSFLLSDSRASSSNQEEGFEADSPPRNNTPATPQSPNLGMADLTPNSQKIAKVVTGELAKIIKQESSGVKRKLDMVLEKEDKTARGVDEVRAGVKEVKKTTQVIDSNQRLALKVKPKNALDGYKQKLTKRSVWRRIQLADPKNVMQNNVYSELKEQDDGVTADKEDHVKKYAWECACYIKSHMRKLVADDLKDQDYVEFSSTTQWLKGYLAEDLLTVSDMEFIRIVATSLVKFDNGKNPDLHGNDLENKKMMAGSVDHWWGYVGAMMKQYIDDVDEESCAPLLKTLMTQIGFEGKK